MKRYKLQLPSEEGRRLDQNEAFFYLLDDSAERKEKIFFHDYSRIYKSPGLYEQIFYDRLRCTSPKVVSEILYKAVTRQNSNFTELRVLDLGAGNGLMGEALKKYGVSRLVGADIESEAKVAAFRDRPGLYDDYYIEDFTNLDVKKTEALSDWSFDCLTTVAALGFGDIPVKAFLQAIRLVKENGWLAFNIKESFLKPIDTSGFSDLIRKLMFSEFIDVHFVERYQHRVSIEGVPLYYFAIVFQKKSNIPLSFCD